MKWYVKANNQVIKEISKKHNISFILSKLLYVREIIEDEEIDNFLYGKIEDISDSKLLSDIDIAIDIIINAIKYNKNIRIVGDYDCDGVMSIVILYKTLSFLKANISYDVPNRVRDGYGINKRIIKKANEDNVDLIITCDNGISQIDEIKYAKELGLKVIVTDHHQTIKDNTNEVLPDADAIINPHKDKCKYPFKNICGAFVSFIICKELLRKFGLENYNDLLEELMLFASIATVSDIMPLKSDNRIIVKEGLRLIEKTTNLGLKSILDVTKLSFPVSSHNVGFIIAPTINACGRLADSKIAVDMFLSDNKNFAYENALKLSEFNNARKIMTEEQFTIASNIIDNSNIKNDNILVIKLESCHESIAGIVAGRIKDKYYKPTFVITKGKNEYKGSARSITPYNIFEEMNKLSNMFIKFGGHPMAAGFSIKEELIDEFRIKINQNSNLTKEDLTQKLEIDLHLPIEKITPALINELSILEPFGEGNKIPLFADKNIKASKAFIFGENKNNIKLILPCKNNKNLQAVLFRRAGEFISYYEKKYGKEEVDNLLNGVENKVEFKFAYTLSFNEYNGNKYIQLIIQNYM